MKFYENTSVAAKFLHADGRMGMAKLIVAFRHFANVPKTHPFCTLIVISCEVVTEIFITYHLGKLHVSKY
jgi:hypothetical protein